MKKILAVLLAIAMICALGVTAFADDAVAPKDGGSKVTFTTGGEAGTYYGFGSVLAQKVSDVTSTSVTAITSGGSAANIDAIDIGDAQLGFSQSDVLAYAYAGERTFEEIGAIDSFSIVAPLYMEQVQIVTLNPDIKTVADLKGKAVSIGAAGSGVYFNAVDVLGAYGIDADKGIDKKTGKLYDGDRYLKEHFPEASGTFVSLTPNGRHYWFYTDKPLNGRVRFAPGLDTRGWHNYICMPGSHCQNGDYVIDLEKFHIDPLPPRILDAVLAAIPQEQPRPAPQEERPCPQKNPPAPKRAESPTETVQTFFSERSLRAAARKVQNSEEGERHSVLFRQAVYVGTCIPRYIQEDDAFDMLYKAAKAAGLEHDEIVRTISDGFRSNVAMTRKHVFDDDPDVPGRNRMRGIFGDTVEEDDEPFSMPHP